MFLLIYDAVKMLKGALMRAGARGETWALFLIRGYHKTLRIPIVGAFLHRVRAALKRAIRQEQKRRKRQAAKKKSTVSASPTEQAVGKKSTVSASPAKQAVAQKAPTNASRHFNGDDLRLTADFDPTEAICSPYVQRQRERIKVLCLNSMGGSMGKLTKALMLHEGIEADCVINAYPPSKHMTHLHETNVNFIYEHHEWKEFLRFAINYYDIVQSTTLPLAKGVAESYDWLTKCLGRRHVWRTTGFIHHYIKKESVLPLAEYHKDLGSRARSPDPSRFNVSTFPIDEEYIYTDPYPIFYSSPEKGVYLKGEWTAWLPSIRDPEEFYSGRGGSLQEKDLLYVYVPYHKRAMFKGLDKALDIVHAVADKNPNVQVVTSETAPEFFPDLKGFAGDGGDTRAPAAYPIPSYNLPLLYSRMDVVIDQFVMGCYGNTAIEAMASGRPVIGQKRYREVYDAPIVDADFDSLADRLEELLQSERLRAELGRKGVEYASKVHSPAAVGRVAAERYRQILSEG